ncbi:PREDICTED: vezatin-like [Priapulus caudatus]|uniref:Vezatin n=1 Tax=Priapulus caudatus TaxID=37621 RepID=A0ABM1F359_PRICU|nr:PREDICTED: vezatin-like [Priapulus caudatus]
MADDSDEEVVFENSPLHNYLRDAGVADVASEVTQTQRRADVFRQEQETRGVSAARRRRKLRTLLASALPSANLEKDYREIDLEFFSLCVKWIFARRALEEDDCVFLESILPEEGEILHSCPNRAVRLLGFAVGTSALVVTMQRLFPTSWYPLLTIATATPFMLHETRQCWQLIRRRTAHRRNFQVLEGFVERREALKLLVRRCVRLIQERELISRGFTIISGQTPLARLEQSSGATHRQCPTLRSLLFETMRDLTLTFRLATAELILRYP